MISSYLGLESGSGGLAQGWGGLVPHNDVNDNDDTYLTPQGHPGLQPRVAFFSTGDLLTSVYLDVGGREPALLPRRAPAPPAARQHLKHDDRVSRREGQVALLLSLVLVDSSVFWKQKSNGLNSQYKESTCYC